MFKKQKKKETNFKTFIQMRQTLEPSEQTSNGDHTFR